MNHPINIAIQNNPYISKLFGFFFFGMVLKYCNIWYDETGMLYSASLKKVSMQNQTIWKWIFMVLLILVNRAYCIILFTILVFLRRRGGAQLFVFLFGFFLYNLQILWGFKINSECWYVVGIAVFFVVSRSHLFSFLFVFAGYQNTIQSNNVFFMLSSTVDLCK